MMDAPAVDGRGRVGGLVAGPPVGVGEVDDAAVELGWGLAADVG